MVHTWHNNSESIGIVNSAEPSCIVRILANILSFYYKDYWLAGYEILYLRGKRLEWVYCSTD